MRRVLFFVLVMGTAMVGEIAAAPARVALVIGNDAYVVQPLTSAVNDAHAISAALKESGFEVRLSENLNRSQMRDAITTFIAEVKKREAISLIYFAGHGVQSGNHNFLLPVDADFKNEEEINSKAIDLQWILDSLPASEAHIKILILDACRSNPFRSRGLFGEPGLAAVDGPLGTFLAFATAPGRVALESKSGNGFYTKHLVNTLKTPGIPIEEVFKRVRFAVKQETLENQRPWENTSLVSDFYFRGASPGEATADRRPLLAVSSEESYWAEIKEGKSIYDMLTYVRRFPNGKYLEDARERVNDVLSRMGAPKLADDEFIEFSRETYAGFGYRRVNEFSARYFGLSTVTGVQVRFVEPNSPAEHAGLKYGDIILEIGGIPIKAEQDLIRNERALKAGEFVSTAVWRNRTRVELSGLIERASIPVLLTRLVAKHGADKRFDRLIPILEYLVKQGNPRAMAMLGGVLSGLSSPGIVPDFARSNRLIQQALDVNEPVALLYSATSYMLGKNVTGGKNFAKGVSFAQGAYEKGIVEAGALMAITYAVGDQSLPADYTKAELLARDSADQGTDLGMYVLGFLYLNGRGVSKDIAQARIWLAHASKAGSKDADELLKKLDRGEFK